MKKSDYTHLLKDATPCAKIDTSGSASQHELGDLAKLDGHASLTQCLNDLNAWGMTVAQVAEVLLSDSGRFTADSKYSAIVHEYAVEASDRGESYDEAKARIESDDSIFRACCEEAGMDDSEIFHALETKDSDP